MKKKAEEIIEPEKKYKVGRWHESPNYECTLCPFSTLSKERMEEHITEVHAPPPTPWTEVKPPKYDRFGNLVEEKE